MLTLENSRPPLSLTHSRLPLASTHTRPISSIFEHHSNINLFQRLSIFISKSYFNYMFCQIPFSLGEDEAKGLDENIFLRGKEIERGVDRVPNERHKRHRASIERCGSLNNSSRPLRTRRTALLRLTAARSREIFESYRTRDLVNQHAL